MALIIRQRIIISINPKPLNFSGYLRPPVPSPITKRVYLEGSLEDENMDTEGVIFEAKNCMKKFQKISPKNMEDFRELLEALEKEVIPCFDARRFGIRSSRGSFGLIK